MGVGISSGISCKTGLNLHLGEMLTNYATNKVESRRRQKNDSIENMNKSKSDSSLFTIVSTKSEQSTEVDQFDPRKRRRDKQIDEHQASQVTYLILPNNECLFFEKLNCELCLQQFTEFDERKQINNRLETIINQSMTNEDNRNNELIGNDENSVDNDSLKTIKSMKLNASLTELDNQDLDFIDQIDESMTNYDSLNKKTKKLSSIGEEFNDLNDCKQMKTDRSEVVKNNLENQLSENDGSLPPRRSSVKVQMSSLTVPSVVNKFSDQNERLNEKNLKQKSKVKQKLKIEIIDVEKSSITNKVDDEESGDDEQLKEISKEEKQKMLKEMIDITKHEQIENYSQSNSVNLENECMNKELIRTELIRSFSADYVRDLLSDELLNEYSELDYINYKLSKLTSLKNSRLMYLSETDLSKLKDNQFDNKSITTIKTELLNLDLIENELLDRDQLESVILDDIEQYETQKINRTNNETNISSRLLSKFKLVSPMVTKTKSTDDLNKRSLVNSWLKREQFDQDYNQFNSVLNQQFNQQFFGQTWLDSRLFISQQLNSNFEDCTVQDCTLCRFNEEQINELDCETVQLMHVLKSLDEILHDKEHQLKQLAEKAKSPPSHLCTAKLLRSRANLKRKVNLLKKRSSRLGISMIKNEQGKQLITFNDGKSTYHIEINDRKFFVFFFIFFNFCNLFLI